MSYSTAALGRPVNGVAFISGTGSSRKESSLPGVAVKKLPQFLHPDVISVDTGVLRKRRLSGEAEPVHARMSSPLQTVFEVLRKDARQPERSLPDSQVRAMIERLSVSDLLRAEPFAERNNLAKEYARFRKLGASAGEKTVLYGDQQDLEVYFYHYRVGRLSELGRGEVRFEYDPSWPFGLTGLPLRTSPPAYEALGLPPFFDNILPEGWAESRLQAVYKIAKDDVYALLRTTPKYLSNLTLRPRGLSEEAISLDYLSASVEQLLPDRTPRSLVSEEIGSAHDTREFWLELRRRGATALSGVQAKLPVHLSGVEGRPRLSLGDLNTTSTHILKLPSHQYADLVQNEWATMELARRVGIDVADVRQVVFQPDSQLDQPGLLIERFDLPRQLESPAVIPLLEDAASLLGLRRAEKYDPSLERIGTALQQAGLDEQGLAAFFDHVVFSWITGNGDLHAKNISVLHEFQPGKLGSPPDRTGVRYSPLYDLLNTRVVLRDDLFALPLNGKRNALRRKDFAVLSRRWGWTNGAAYNRIERLINATRTHVEAVLGLSGLPEPAQEQYAAIVAANTRGLLM
ncbi:MAG TPA: HipA domain-containing protein [Longimicrobiales bacterium]